MLFCAMGCPGPPVRGSARITLQQHLMAWMSPWVSGQEDTDGPVGGKAAAHNHTHSRVHTQSHITHTQILTHNHIHSLVHNAHTLPCTHTLYTRTNSHRHTVQAYTVHATHTPVCVAAQVCFPGKHLSHYWKGPMPSQSSAVSVRLCSGSRRSRLALPLGHGVRVWGLMGLRTELNEDGTLSCSGATSPEG